MNESAEITCVIPSEVEESPSGGRSLDFARDDSGRAHRSKQSGFSLIELIVVVTIIGILAGIAMINVRTAQLKARESALRENLHQMRKAIDNFYADKQRFPSNLEELVPNYIRKIPPDPITGQVDWEEVMDDPLAGGLDQPPAETDPQAVTTPGVSDVKSRAEGTTLDNVPYNEL